MFVDVLLALTPQAQKQLQIMGVLLLVLAGGFFVYLVVMSWVYSMKRVGRVLATVFEIDGNISNELARPFVNGRHDLVELKDGGIYIIDPAAKYYRVWPGVWPKWVNGPIPTFFYRRGVANPIVLQAVNPGTPILAASSLKSMINTAFMWVGITFVDKLQRGQEAAMNNPKLLLWLLIIMLILMAGVGFGVYQVYQHLSEIMLRLQQVAS